MSMVVAWIDWLDTKGKIIYHEYPRSSLIATKAMVQEKLVVGTDIRLCYEF